MNFHGLRSIVAAQKSTFTMRASSASFGPAPKREQPYIEPAFTKVEFENERPAVLLISAVGATGKSALAQVLSNETGLPLLDLGKHKPVGDNTLTGLLHTAFPVEALSSIFEGLGKGTYGVIVDGIDEGRSKTTQLAFEAFLDDLARLCVGCHTTTFVLLGRTQALDDCWLYLTEKGVSTGLLTIAPFSLDGARRYVDVFTGGMQSSYAAQYSRVRDSILNMLGAAFDDNAGGGDEAFLSFIGYPPVLDAIVTLLKADPNFHRIEKELEDRDSNDVEINLLYRIASYILHREKEQKVLPNIVASLIADMPKDRQEAIVEQVFEPEEQCARLVSHCLGRPLSLEQIADIRVNDEYEMRLLGWLHEHPFIRGREFRNAVFEGFALATLLASRDPGALQLVLEYAVSHKHNYHLIYFLDRTAQDGEVPIECLHVIIGSALEFRSTTSSIELHVEGSDADGQILGGASAQVVETEIEVLMGPERANSTVFRFRSDLGERPSVLLGNRLSSTYVSLPCEVVLSGMQEVELTAPVAILAETISLRAQALTLKYPPQPASDEYVLLEARRVNSTLGTISTSGVGLIIAVSDRTGLTYPAVRFVEQRVVLPPDPLLKEKYLRLRRILVHFRSHSRGSLAKYRPKIDHERVLRNEMGRAILQRLLDDSILTLSGNFYFLRPENVDKHLGVSWSDLSKGRSSERLLQYLRSIK